MYDGYMYLYIHLTVYSKITLVVASATQSTRVIRDKAADSASRINHMVSMFSD